MLPACLCGISQRRCCCTAFGSKGEAEVQIYRTDGRDNMRCIQSFAAPAPVKFAIVIPPMSMTTIVMHIKQQYRVKR